MPDVSPHHYQTQAKAPIRAVQDQDYSYELPPTQGGLPSLSRQPHYRGVRDKTRPYAGCHVGRRILGSIALSWLGANISVRLDIYEPCLRPNTGPAQFLTVPSPYYNLYHSERRAVYGPTGETPPTIHDRTTDALVWCRRVH